ncbi:Transcription initiation factor TFIID subunit 8 [Acropora cervicornis]|uniref:Transcription initiation factor TFIID subunit 8 n=1 Tax=Acropora cervicornis TaxID=6130 RepID=A0AAD9QW58_ACRCE|nr:Transcription initiation factor TFIID subunit 8 [Acropora cervicornis]
MADISSVNRRLLEISICALLREQGFASASKLALETLTEMLQSYLSELGQSCKLCCELSARVKPTLSDVKVALIDMGADLDSLPIYGKRTSRVSVNNPLKSRITPLPKSLAAGTKQTRPVYIPAHLPPLPDPHSYIKTPVSSKTAELSSGICEGLDAPSFPLLVNETPVLPYLQAVGDLDEIELLPEGTNVRESSSNGTLSTGLPNTDTCDNPYLRPAKRLRGTLKTS